MKIAPLTALLCALPLAGCYVVQYPGGALTLSPTPTAPQAMRAAPGATDVSTAPVPTPSVTSAPVKAAAPPPPGKAARQTYPNGSPVPPDYRPQAAPSSRTPVYPNGSPVPPDYVPPPAPRAATNAQPSVPYATDPGYVPYPAYSAYPTYSAYSAYTPYPAYPSYPVYGGYAPYYPSFAPSPWISNVSFSFSWGRGWGGWGGRCCHRWR